MSRVGPLRSTVRRFPVGRRRDGAGVRPRAGIAKTGGGRARLVSRAAPWRASSGRSAQSTPDGGTESLLIIVGTPIARFRAQGDTAVEVSFTQALKDSARRNIRRAVKLALTVRFEDNESFVAEHYAQLREVFVRGGNTVSFGEERVLEFFRRMRVAGRLIAASVSLPDGISIATGLFTMTA